MSGDGDVALLRKENNALNKVQSIYPMDFVVKFIVDMM